MQGMIARITCLLAASLCLGETVNIAGTVRDSSTEAGLSGAIVRLVRSGIADTTDSTGAFALTGQAVPTHPGIFPAAMSTPPVVSAAGLKIGLVQPGRLVTGGYTLDGRQISHSDQMLTAGEHVIDCRARASGATLYRVRTCGREYVLLEAHTEGGARAGAMQSKQSSGRAGLAKRAAGFTDTIVVSKNGYGTRMLAVTSATASGIVIELAGGGDTVVDMDGNVYHTVTIGAQVWMLENLKSTKYRDGTAIPLVADSAAWSELSTPACCWYNNDISNKATYGALYNWHAVNTGKLAPAGWHVPTEAEWTTLTAYLGDASVAGGKLKEADTSHWQSPNAGATNSSGFAALPGGCRYASGMFYSIGSNGNWWSASAYDAMYAWIRSMSYAYVHVDRNNNNVRYGFSVRCVRD